MLFKVIPEEIFLEFNHPAKSEYSLNYSKLLEFFSIKLKHGLKKNVPQKRIINIENHCTENTKLIKVH